MHINCCTALPIRKCCILFRRRNYIPTPAIHHVRLVHFVPSNMKFEWTMSAKESMHFRYFYVAYLPGAGWQKCNSAPITAGLHARLVHWWQNAKKIVPPTPPICILNVSIVVSLTSYDYALHSPQAPANTCPPCQPVALGAIYGWYSSVYTCRIILLHTLRCRNLKVQFGAATFCCILGAWCIRSNFSRWKCRCDAHTYTHTLYIHAYTEHSLFKSEWRIC